MRKEREGEGVSLTIPARRGSSDKLRGYKRPCGLRLVVAAVTRTVWSHGRGQSEHNEVMVKEEKTQSESSTEA